MPLTQTDERVRLADIPSSRYSVGDMKNLITDKLQVIDGTVDKITAAEIETLLKGRKTNVMALNDGSTARLYIHNSPQSGPAIHQIDVQASLRLNDTYLGHTFTPTDKANLNRYGDMGRPVSLNDHRTGEPFNAFVGVDPQTNKLNVMRVDKVRIPEALHGKTLSPAQKNILLAGKAIRLDGMVHNGNSFSKYVRLAASRADKGGFKYDNIYAPAQKTKQEQTVGSPEQKTRQGIKVERKADPKQTAETTAGLKNQKVPKASQDAAIAAPTLKPGGVAKQNQPKAEKSPEGNAPKATKTAKTKTAPIAAVTPKAEGSKPKARKVSH